MCVTDAYIVLNDYQSAIKALDAYLLYEGKQDLSNYWTAATLYEKLGIYDEALSLYKEYLYESDHTTVAAVRSDAKYIEERFKAFLENTTRRVEIFQKSRLGLDSSLEGPFPYLFASTNSKVRPFERYAGFTSLVLYIWQICVYITMFKWSELMTQK